MDGLEVTVILGDLNAIFIMGLGSISKWPSHFRYFLTISYITHHPILVHKWNGLQKKTFWHIKQITIEITINQACRFFTRSKPLQTSLNLEGKEESQFTPKEKRGKYCGKIWTWLATRIWPSNWHAFSI